MCKKNAHYKGVLMKEDLSDFLKIAYKYGRVKELEEAFTENGITNISYNDPFKGGAITQGIYSLENVDVIQLEINGRYRDYNNLELLEIIIESLSNFIKQYNNYINR